MAHKVPPSGGWGKTRFRIIPSCHPERRNQKNGLCKQCFRVSLEGQAYARAYYQANKPAFATRYRERSKNGLLRQQEVTRRYGLSEEQQAAILEAQGHGCAICNSRRGSRRLSIDHDHSTGQVRGMLCGPCNMALGGFRDDPALCLKAAEYLRSYSAVSLVSGNSATR